MFWQQFVKIMLWDRGLFFTKMMVVFLSELDLMPVIGAVVNPTVTLYTDENLQPRQLE